MGYTTYFSGEFLLDRPLTVDHKIILEGFAAQQHDIESIEGTYCGWVPSHDGTEIVWDEAEKFYGYVDWLGYLIDKFLRPWGYVLNGEVRWEGEESDDRGVIYCKDNQVEEVQDTITNAGPSWDPRSAPAECYPDLLAACKKAAAWCDQVAITAKTPGPAERMRDILEAALAKAEGGRDDPS